MRSRRPIVGRGDERTHALRARTPCVVFARRFAGLLPRSASLAGGETCRQESAKAISARREALRRVRRSSYELCSIVLPRLFRSPFSARATPLPFPVWRLRPSRVGVLFARRWWSDCDQGSALGRCCCTSLIRREQGRHCCCTHPALSALVYLAHAYARHMGTLSGCSGPARKLVVP